MTSDPLVFIKHMIQNIENIELFSAKITKENFLRDKLKQYAIVRAIEIIGEAAKNLSQSFKNNHPQVNWKDIIGTRDRIIHHYFGVDLDIVWEIIIKYIPDLKKKLLHIISRESNK